jgi:hypothetical protein
VASDVNLFWTILILVPVGLLLLFSGLFILVIIVMGIVGAVDGFATAMRHRRGLPRVMPKPRAGANGRTIGGPALHH